MSDNSLLPSSPEVRSLAGSYLMITLLQSVETGVIIGQAITFWSYSSTPLTNIDQRANHERVQHASAPPKVPRERKLMMAVATYVLLVALLQTTFNFYDTWTGLVVNWGRLPDALEIHWLTKLQPTVNVMLAVPVQGFLTWRCWLVTGRNNYLLFFLLTLVLASFVLSVLVTVQWFSVNLTAATVRAGVLSGGIFSASLAVPTLLDTLLSGLLLTYFLRSRSFVVSRRFRKVLENLMVIIWEAAFPPTVCTVITLAVYSRSEQPSIYFLLFQAILGQLYVISFFVTVNGFLSVKNQENGVSPAIALGTGWGTVLQDRHGSGRNQEIAFASGREDPTNGITVTVNVQTTLDPPLGPGITVPRSLTSRLPRFSNMKSSQHRLSSQNPRTIEPPVAIRLPGPNAKDSADEVDTYVKGARENSDCEDGRDGK